MIHLLVAAVLGVIEGITEFLPISSTGHLILAEHIMGFKDTEDIFTVVIQVGAIAAVIWLFRKDLIARIIGLFKRDPAALMFWKLLIIATVPAGIFGLLLDNSMTAITIPFVVAIALIAGGFILIAVENKQARRPRQRRAPEVDLSQITLRQAVLVGLAQCVAIIPGVSRSGATIVGGLLTGINRPTATAFSFYLSIPVLVLASAYKLVKHGDQLSSIPGGIPALVIGTVVSFIVALAVIKWLLKYVSTHDFKPFAYYRIVLGALILILLAAGTNL